MPGQGRAAPQPCPVQPSPARRADMASYIGLRLDEPDIVVTVQVVYRGQYPHSSPEFLNPAPTGRATALLPPPLPAQRCATPTLPCCTAGADSKNRQVLSCNKWLSPNVKSEVIRYENFGVIIPV